MRAIAFAGALAALASTAYSQGIVVKEHEGIPQEPWDGIRASDEEERP